MTERATPEIIRTLPGRTVQRLLAKRRVDSLYREAHLCEAMTRASREASSETAKTRVHRMAAEVAVIHALCHPATRGVVRRALADWAPSRRRERAEALRTQHGRGPEKTAARRLDGMAASPRRIPAQAVSRNNEGGNAMHLPHLPILTRWFDCYVTGWNRLCVRLGRVRLILGRRTRSRIPIRYEWLPRSSTRSGGSGSQHDARGVIAPARMDRKHGERRQRPS